MTMSTALEQPRPTAFERRLVPGQRVDLRRPVATPPRWVIAYTASSASTMRLASSSVWPGVNQIVECDPTAVALAVVVEPQVVAIAGPEVDHLGIGEEGDVDGVIGLVVGQEDVGHGLRRDTEAAQRVEDPRARGDHAGVDDDERVAVTDEHDAAGAPLVGVARRQQMDAVIGAW